MRQILESNPAAVFLNPNSPPATGGLAGLVHELAQMPLAGRFAYIYDYRVRGLLFVSAGIEQLLGAAPPTAAQTVEWLYERLHPDDASAVARASVLVNTFIRERPADEDFGPFLMAIDYRLRHAAGHYVRVLRHNTILERDHTGAVITTAAIYTDITTHKNTTDVRLHVNWPAFAAFARQFASALMHLSRREQQVYELVLDGLTSSQIAQQLGLSENTVKTHRRNVLAKLPARGWFSLLAYL